MRELVFSLDSGRTGGHPGGADFPRTALRGAAASRAGNSGGRFVSEATAWLHLPDLDHESIED